TRHERTSLWPERYMNRRGVETLPTSSSFPSGKPEWRHPGYRHGRSCRATGMSRPAQRCQKGLEAVVVDLAHQSEQATDFPRRITIAIEPVQIVARQVGNQPPLVLSKGHGA